MHAVSGTGDARGAIGWSRIVAENWEVVVICTRQILRLSVIVEGM
jgi:hypothetical protein